MILKNFINFIREQGVIGLAVGFILGGSIQKVVSSIVNDLINPVLGILLGAVGNLSDYYWQVGGAKVMYGRFVANLIDFVTIATVIYVSIKLLRFDRLDKKKEKKPQEVVIVTPDASATVKQTTSSQKVSQSDKHLTK